jgi:hypothetical protein
LYANKNIKNEGFFFEFFVEKYRIRLIIILIFEENSFFFCRNWKNKDLKKWPPPTPPPSPQKNKELNGRSRIV